MRTQRAEEVAAGVVFALTGGRSKVTRGNPSPLVYELEACRHGVDAL